MHHRFNDNTVLFCSLFFFLLTQKRKKGNFKKNYFKNLFQKKKKSMIPSIKVMQANGRLEHFVSDCTSDGKSQ